jgi:hypothetical protein
MSAFGGEADMPRTRAADRSVANDPKQTWGHRVSAGTGGENFGQWVFAPTSRRKNAHCHGATVVNGERAKSGWRILAGFRSRNSTVGLGFVFFGIESLTAPTPG